MPLRFPSLGGERRNGWATEALAWARLAQAVARLRERAGVDLSPVNEADYRRVATLVREEGFDFDVALAELSSSGNCGVVSESVPRNFATSDTLTDANPPPDAEIP